MMKVGHPMGVSKQQKRLMVRLMTNSLQVPAKDQKALLEEQVAVPGVPVYPVAQVALLHVVTAAVEPPHK
jgi:hypothetical protein